MQKYLRISAYFIFILISLVGLAACGPGAPEVKGIATDIEIRYQREGGFAGITQEWTIFPDGRIIGPGEQEMQVPPKEIIPLLATAAEFESASLNASYIPKDACCDQFTYTITIKMNGQETTIQTSDEADNPELVSLLLAEIDRLIAMAEPVE